MSNIKLTDNIIELNRDVESLVVQGASGRGCLDFGDKYKPLQFVHCSDMHFRPDLFSRMAEYVNYYEKYIAFILHTGDYCGGAQYQYADMIGIANCKRESYNCVGNHDTEENFDYEKGNPKKATKQSVHEKLFNHTENWNVEFAPVEYSLSYYKDFPENGGIRLVVLDLYYDIEKQCEWLRKVLDDARSKNMHVVTAMHEPSDEITHPIDVTFSTINEYGKIKKRRPKHPYEDIISAFVKEGGIHVCNLAGHLHHDLFGYTDSGILNCIVDCGTAWTGESDADRVEGTRTFDSFNVTSVDVITGTLKLIRVGNNADNFLRIKRALCYDYINKRVVFNG
jgi:hypothetical protein